MKFLLHPAYVWIALSLELAIAPRVLAEVQLKTPNSESHNQQLSEDLPPPPRNPDSTTGGGTRNGGTCPEDARTSDQPLTALSPTTRLGLALAERPTFLVYVPRTAAQVAEFSLLDQNNQGIYQTTFALKDTPGIVSFNLPPNAPSLEIGKDYTWSFALICNPKNRLQDRFVSGKIRRTEIEAALRRQIDQATPKERVSLYRKASIWYEAMFTLLELQRSEPNDSSLGVAWKELLQSSGLDAIPVQPLGK